MPETKMIEEKNTKRDQCDHVAKINTINSRLGPV